MPRGALVWDRQVAGESICGNKRGCGTGAWESECWVHVESDAKMRAPAHCGGSAPVHRVGEHTGGVKVLPSIAPLIDEPKCAEYSASSSHSHEGAWLIVADTSLAVPYLIASLSARGGWQMRLGRVIKLGGLGLAGPLGGGAPLQHQYRQVQSPKRARMNAVTSTSPAYGRPHQRERRRVQPMGRRYTEEWGSRHDWSYCAAARQGRARSAGPARRCRPPGCRRYRCRSQAAQRRRARH
eukprot:scaffold6550_cov131-Isochrysis_galbana.AAC.7